MRIWDLNPGYLNRQSLLGEHRELHGIVSIIKNNKKGYSRHPETIRWLQHGWAVRQRHQLLKSEMELRGYQDKSPVNLRAKPNQWPDTFIDSPYQQFQIVKKKYEHLEWGRIPLPKNAQELWAQHKYSVMARDIAAYKRIGKEVAKNNSKQFFEALCLELTLLLRQSPNPKLINNALQHMWGYVSDYYDGDKASVINNNSKMLKLTRQLSIEHQVTYLLHSTALSELDSWNID